MVNAGSLVTRLAGDPDLPRLVGRHVDLHAASGCAAQALGGAPSMATVTKPSLSSLLTGRKTRATSPVLLDTALLCDTALAWFWPTLTPDSHKRSLAVAHGGKRDFDLQLKGRSKSHVNPKHLQFRNAHGAMALDILAAGTRHYTAPHIEENARAQVVQHVGPARKFFVLQALVLKDQELL